MAEWSHRPHLIRQALYTAAPPEPVLALAETRAAIRVNVSSMRRIVARFPVSRIKLPSKRSLIPSAQSLMPPNTSSYFTHAAFQHVDFRHRRPRKSSAPPGSGSPDHCIPWLDEPPLVTISEQTVSENRKNGVDDGNDGTLEDEGPPPSRESAPDEMDVRWTVSCPAVACRAGEAVFGSLALDLCLFYPPQPPPSPPPAGACADINSLKRRKEMLAPARNHTTLVSPSFARRD